MSRVFVSREAPLTKGRRTILEDNSLKHKTKAQEVNVKCSKDLSLFHRGLSRFNSLPKWHLRTLQGIQRNLLSLLLL